MKTLIILSFFLFISKSLYTQWSSKAGVNLQVSDLSGDQATPKIAATTDGGCYICWFDHRGSNYDVYLQRLNSSGIKQFANDGLLISNNPQNSSLVGYDLAVDASNNAVIAFTDIRNGSVINPFAYLISPAGTFLWGASGVSLTDSIASFQPNPKIVVTSDGNYIFVWRLGSGPQKVAMQKLNSAGVKQWGTSPIIFSSGTAENYDWTEAISSDNGSMIMMWSGYTGNFITAANYKIYTQKFSSAGTRVWNGTQDTVYSLGRVGGFYNPRVFSDGNNGAVYCWRDDRNSLNLYTGYVQRKTSGGTFLFPINGSAVSTQPGMYHFDPIATVMQSTGETYTVFSDANSTQSQFSVMGQRFSSNGGRLWSDNGVIFLPMSTNQPSFYSVFTKDTSAVFHFSLNTGGTNVNIKSFKSDRNGNLQWGGVILTSSSYSSNKLRLQSAFSPAGMSMLTWSDNRNDAGGIYAQNVNYDGSLGIFLGIHQIGNEIPNKFSLEQNYPNPFNPNSKIKMQIAKLSKVRLVVFDVLGREIETLVNEQLQPGTYEFDFDGSKLASGVYYYKLTADNYRETRKMVLIK